MKTAWKTYVADLCYDAWELSPHRTQKLIEDIEVLITTDQLSDFALAGVLSSVGMSQSFAGAAAESIRATIRGHPPM